MGIFNWGRNSGKDTYDASKMFYDRRSAEKIERLKRYERAWASYTAENPDAVVKDTVSQDNVKVNPARALVNTGVYFLFGDSRNSVAFESRPEDPDEANQVDQKPSWLKDLNQLWKANKKDSWFLNWGISGGIHGQTFVKFVPNGAGINNDIPRLVLLDPSIVDVETDPNDCEKVIKWIIEYVVEKEDGTPLCRIQEITPNEENGRVVSWTMQDYEHEMGFVNGAGWLPSAGEKNPVGPAEIWPYPWPPIETCQNIELPHVFWGMPDLDTASIDVIESIQRSMTSLNKIVRIHASPRMFAKGVMPDMAAEIDVSADNIITIPSVDGDLQVLQTLQNISPSVDFTEKLREDLYEMMQIPPIALGKFETASTSISGITLSILYAPLLQRTDLKRVSYGSMLVRLCQKALILMGHDLDSLEDLSVVWPESMPGSAFLERQTLKEDQALGLSTRTVLERLGYNPDEELKNKEDETRAEKELEKEFAPKPELGMGSGNNAPAGGSNPTGKGQRGNMAATKSAGTPKTKKNE